MTFCEDNSVLLFKYYISIEYKMPYTINFNTPGSSPKTIAKEPELKRGFDGAVVLVNKDDNTNSHLAFLDSVLDPNGAELYKFTNDVADFSVSISKKGTVIGTQKYATGAPGRTANEYVGNLTGGYRRRRKTRRSKRRSTKSRRRRA
jgi:hypothetical protein